MAKFDFKQAVVNHIEKAVFGIVMLVVLIGLASTNWSTYKGTPDEIVEKVKQGKRTLYSNVWPDEEKEQYMLTDQNKPNQVVYEKLRKEHNPANYDFSAKFVTRPGGADEPLRDPELYAPQDPIASYTKVFIETAPAAVESESEVGLDGALALGTDPADDDPNILDEFRKRDPAMSGTMGTGGAGMYADEAMELSYNGGMDADYMGGTESEDYMDGMGSGMTGVKKSGQGYQAVSVRAIFPLRDQIRKFADAINKPYYEATRSFEIIDFNLERQTMQPGADPWAGDWVPVDINVAYDVLNNANGFEPDVVNGLITNGVITMPLPMRISGQWRNQATHPRIKNFELSEEQMKLELEMNRKMLQEVVDERIAMRETEVELGGFSGVQFNSGDLQAQLMGGDSMYDMAADYEMGGGGGGSSMLGGGRTRGRNPKGSAVAANNPTEQLVQKLMESSDKSKDPKEQEKLIREWITERASVEGELLLFRYFDFSVEPGKTYRYRVQLVLNNPNYGMRVADAGGLASVVEGQTRTTDWSESTPPVVVEELINYFMADVRNPRSTRLYPTAEMDVYQWDTTQGTTINEDFEVQLGQKFSEKVKTLVINPAEQTYEESQEYTFTANDFLVDTIEDFEIDDEFHSGDRVDPDYKLPNMPGVHGKLALTGQVIVKDLDKGLAVLDPARNSKQHEYMKSYVKQQKEAFEYIKESATASLDMEGYGEYGELSGDYMMDEMYGGGGAGGASRNRNALRRGGGRRGKAGSSGSSGYMGTP